MQKHFKYLAISLSLALSFASISLYAQSDTSKKPVFKIKSSVIKSDLNGFSLRIPDNAQRTINKENRFLAQWGKFDKEGNPTWRFTITKRTGVPHKLDMSKYTTALAGSIEASSNGLANIKSANNTIICNRKATYIAGEIYNMSKKASMNTGEKRKLVSTFNQVWVIYKPGEMIVFKFEALASQKNASQIWNKIYKSINLFDNSDAIKEAKKAVENTIKLIKNLSAKKIKRALPKKPEYFIFYKHTKPIGWLRTTYKEVERNEEKGFQTQSFGYLYIPKKRGVKNSSDLMQLLRKQTFLHDDFETECWSKNIQISVPGEAKNKTQVIDRSGIRKQSFIVSTQGVETNAKVTQKMIPKDISRILLDKTIEKLFPKLIDLSKPKKYSFSTYSQEDNMFTYRSYTVCKPCKTVVQGRVVEAIKIEYLPAQFDKVLEIYVDKKGNVLKEMLPNGMVKEATSWEQIKATFTDKQHANPAKLLNQLIKAHAKSYESLSY